MMNAGQNTNMDLCVCCGNPVPEGRMICQSCEDGNIELTQPEKIPFGKRIRRLLTQKRKVNEFGK